MRTLSLIGLVLGVLAATALASPAVWSAFAAAGYPFTFGRLFDRVFQVGLGIALALAWRRLDLGGPADLGLRRTGWLRELGRGLGLGLTGLACGLALLWAAGGLSLELRYDAAKTVQKALLGLGAAVALGFGEELLFRGVLLRRLGRDLGLALGVALTTAIYAAVHVLRMRGAPVAVDAWSGVERLAVLFAPLGNGAAWRELVGLSLLGLLLAFARLRTGSLWTAIGIHAAWVAVFRVGRLFFSLAPTPAWLVGVGWPPFVGGAAAWLAVGLTAMLLVRRR